MNNKTTVTAATATRWTFAALVFSAVVFLTTTPTDAKCPGWTGCPTKTLTSSSLNLGDKDVVVISGTSGVMAKAVTKTKKVAAATKPAKAVTKVMKAKSSLVKGKQVFCKQAGTDGKQFVATQYLQKEGISPFMKMLVDADEAVAYKITPVYSSKKNLVCNGVRMEARSVHSDAVRISLYAFNIQPGLKINYKTGAVNESGKLNTETYKAVQYSKAKNADTTVSAPLHTAAVCKLEAEGSVQGSEITELLTDLDSCKGKLDKDHIIESYVRFLPGQSRMVSSAEIEADYLTASAVSKFC
jgi:hypothetical protein